MDLYAYGWISFTGLLICYIFYQFHGYLRLTELNLKLIRSQLVDRREIKVGDHIYCLVEYPDSYHGIFYNEGMVLHFDADKKKFNSDSCPQPNPNGCVKPTPNCGFRLPGSGVLLSCLNCFTQKRPLYRFEYGVGIISFLFRLCAGTCTMAMADSSEEVLHRANHFLQKGIKLRNSFIRNSKDFALYCKTGLVVPQDNNVLRTGGQLHSFVVAILTVIVLSPIIQLIPNRVLALVVTAGIYMFTTHVVRGGDVVSGSDKHMFEEVMLSVVLLKKFVKKILD